MKTKNKTESKAIKDMLRELENKLLDVSKKLPQLPNSVSELLVKYGPYLMIVSLVIWVISMLTTFGLVTMISPIARVGWSYGYRYGVRFLLHGIISLISIVLMAMAIPGLLKRSKKAWNLMFYSSLVTVVSYLININLGSLIVGTAINWYFLFQIRKFYK